MFLWNTCTCYKNMYFPRIMSLVWLCRVKYHFQGVSRPYWRCLGRFMRLFYHFTRFYGLKYTYRWQSRSSWPKSKYCVNDQNISLMWSWGVTYHIQVVSRPYRVCLDIFMISLHNYFIILSGFMIQGIKYHLDYISYHTVTSTKYR